MTDIIEQIRKDVGLTKALAEHLYQLLVNEYVQLPRMEAYRLRRYMKQHNTIIFSGYGKGYYMLPEDKRVYQNWFNLPQTPDQ